MASGGEVTPFDPKTHIDATKKEWLRKQKVFRDMYYAKSNYPPMVIEPFPYERQRIPFKMTPADRALRHQWLRDQVLSPNEPRMVPELLPRNVFRRTFGLPWDAATKLVISTFGMHPARYFRYLGPKVAMYFAGLFFVFDYVKHNRAGWDQVKGWYVYSNKMPIYPGEPIPENPWRDYQEKSRADFCDKGFSKRTTHLS